MDDLRLFELAWRASGRSEATRYTYGLYVRRYEAAGHTLPPTLAEARVWIGELRQAGVKSQSLGVMVRAIKAFSRWWGEENDVPDPLAKLRHIKADASPPGKVACDDDIDRLLRAVKGKRDFASARDRAIIVLLRDSGIRRAELTRMRVADINLDEGVIILPRTKSYKPRAIPLSREARLQLGRYLKLREAHRAAHLPDLWLSRTRSCGLRADSIGPIFESLAKRTGVKISPHQLRRRFAAEWARKGGSDDTLMSIAGWSSPAMPHRYRQAVRQELAFSAFHRIVDGEG